MHVEQHESTQERHSRKDRKMKKLKKMMALVIAMVMMVAMAIPAMAATITINRDRTWDENAESAEATYTYYKIFDAKDIDQEVDETTGAQTADSNKVAVYWVDTLAKASALPNIFKVNNKTPGALTAADAAGDGLFYVTLADDSTSAADIAAALKTMVEDNTALFPAQTETSDANPVVIDGLDDGYYLIKASNGSVLAVQTLDEVTINEKNDYPKVDKKQGEDATTITYADDETTVKVGDYINYQVTVTIPENANKDIVVGDIMSAGLEYDDTTGLTYSPDISSSIAEVASTDAGYNANATWQIKIPAATVIANKGTDVVITYRAKVTAAALTDTDKENKVTLTYDEGNYVVKDTVEYDTYFAGIYKVDPKDASANMSGVKFTLADGDGNAINVTYDSTNGYYVVDPDSNSNEVETRVDGSYYTIKIRGLDGDVIYKLTETETVSGYNLLEGDTTLTLYKEGEVDFATKAGNTFDKVENNKGSVLPSTGGMGTTLFYIVGGALVAAAGILLLLKKRNTEN